MQETFAALITIETGLKNIEFRLLILSDSEQQEDDSSLEVLTDKKFGERTKSVLTSFQDIDTPIKFQQTVGRLRSLCSLISLTQPPETKIEKSILLDCMKHETLLSSNVAGRMLWESPCMKNVIQHIVRKVLIA